MVEDLGSRITTSFQVNIIDYFKNLQTNPLDIIALIIDIILVVFLIVKFVDIAKNSRVWQLLKGIVLLVAATILSEFFNLKLLNFILTSFMTYGMIALIVIFQPELRRALEQLGSNKITRLFGIDKSIRTKTKEDIYKIVIATQELAKTKTGALIVIERDIKIQDIIETGISVNSDVSPQLLVNIFTPNTPLHDGAVIISNNKIAASACILPLADDKDIARELGTRHRAAVGMSKESDALAVVVSEETGKVSIAKDGTLIADLKEETLKKILIKYIVTARFGDEKREERMANFKQKFGKKDKTSKKDNKENEDSKDDIKEESK